MSNNGNKLPEPLEMFGFHGLDIHHRQGEQEAVSDCPLCGKEGKFSINADTGNWQCFSCGDSGGPLKFLSCLLEASEAYECNFAGLAKDRGLKRASTLERWRVCRSAITGEWMVPGWGIGREDKLAIHQLYLYRKVWVNNKSRMALMPTPNIGGHTLWGLNLWNDEAPNVYLCEGLWDALRLWEVLGRTTTTEAGDYELLKEAKGDEYTLLGESNVLATPSATVMRDNWGRWFKGRNVVSLYDNDHPRIHPKTKKEIASPGLKATKRLAGKFGRDMQSLGYHHWGPDGYNPELKDGYDVRDVLNSTGAIKGLESLLGNCQPVPDEWYAVDADGGELRPKPCTNWKQLTTSWRKAMKWTDGLDHALAVMLASGSSTMFLGDQLWIKIIGPASCGKSTLCEAMSVSKKYVKATSTFKGFLSGHTKARDNSLIDLINGKTFITKDGDTLIQQPNFTQILSEGRDLYDRVTRSHYRNAEGKDYTGVNTTWLLCGTSSLRRIDQSELGERFLDCVIMEEIDNEIENDILLRVAHKADKLSSMESVGDAKTQHSEELAEAMELTAGYLEWLRENAARLLPEVKFPDKYMKKCIYLGKFVAYMRARPSKEQREKDERELGARLVSQHIRLAKYLTLVLNQPEVNATVMKRVWRVGLDTSRGVVLEIVRKMYAAESLEARAIRYGHNLTPGECQRLIKFLCNIKAIERLPSNTRNAYRLTDNMRDLFTKATRKIT